MTDQDLYAVKFIGAADKWSSPKSRNIFTICYQGDFYNLDKEQVNDNLVPIDHVERSVFWYERSYFEELISETLRGKFRDDLIRELPKFFLSMKHRNPEFRKYFTEESVKKTFDDIIPEFKKKFSWIDDSMLDELIKRSEEKLMSSHDIPKKLHTNSLLKASEGKNEAYQDVLLQISEYSIVFLEISDENNFFLTSDSPGFSVDINKNVHNIKYKDDLFHFMPLHPKLAVGLMKPKHTVFNKKVSKVAASKEQIEQINFGTTVTCNEYLFGYDYVHLQQHTKRIYK